MNPGSTSRHLIADLGSCLISNFPPLLPIGPVPCYLDQPPIILPSAIALFYSGQVTLDKKQVEELLTGRLYANFTSAAFPRGELRGQIFPSIPIQFTTSLSGTTEIPRNASPHHGSGVFTLVGANLNYTFAVDSELGQISVGVFNPEGKRRGNGHLVFAIDTTYGVVIPEGGFPGQPGSPGQTLYGGSITLTDEQAGELRRGECYLNISTAQFPRGEIRGQILPLDSDHDGVPDWLEAYLAQVLPCDAPWRNHGEYVNRVTRLTSQFAVSGEISWHQLCQILRGVMRSNCGSSR